MELFAQLSSSPFALLLATLVTIGVLKVFSVLYRGYFYWKTHNVPYLSGVPVLGPAWKVFFRRMGFIDYCCYIYNYFPDAKYFGIFDFNTPTVVLRDPELIKNITVKDFEHFTDHRTFGDDSMDPLFAKNIFALRGDRWRDMRNTLSPSFTASKMKIMFDLISKCCHDFVDYLVDHPELCSSIDTKEAFRRYTTDVIATAAFGINVNSMKDRNNEFYVKGVQISKFGSTSFLLKMILFQVSPWLAKVTGISFFPPALSKFFKKIVEETITMRKKHGIIRPDMIHLLMQAQDKDDAREMTIDDIVAQAFIFFLAGFETASQLMCFAAHELAVNQDIQERLREEVEQYFVEETDEITYESLSKMTYMDMVISETLRKYPPAIAIDRVCVKKYELPSAQSNCNSYTVNPGMVMSIPVVAFHNDPKYFPNPQNFDPERFNDENKDNINPYTYLPFGVGPRKCIGNRFALMETKLLLAHLLHKFILKTTEKTIEPIVFDKKQTFALQPVGGFWIGLQKREI